VDFFSFVSGGDNRCQLCKKNLWEHSHHLFSQSKLNIKLYPEFIHNEKNIMKLCSQCHLQKVIPKLSELEFCNIMQITPRSKILRK
jgi:hypothetical protein